MSCNGIAKQLEKFTKEVPFTSSLKIKDSLGYKLTYPLGMSYETKEFCGQSEYDGNHALSLPRALWVKSILEKQSYGQVQFKEVLYKGSNNAGDGDRELDKRVAIDLTLR